MTQKFNKQDIGRISYLDNNNIRIGNQQKEVSLNVRNASLIKDVEQLKITIIANINVEISYEGVVIKNQFGNSNSREGALLKDYNELNDLITISRKTPSWKLR